MANLRHGAHQFDRTNKLPPGHDDVKAELKQFYQEMVALYCSNGGPNPHQEELLQRATHKLGFIKLCEADAWERGPMCRNENGQMEMIPSLGKQYLAFSNSFRLLMRELREISLGKGKKNDLQDYLEKHYGNKAKKGEK